MSSESDDDLLALAGADSETEDEMPTKKQKTESASPEPPAPKLEGEEDDEEPEEAEDTEAVPYPLQGKFKDDADRDHLLGLPELERESILFDRAEEMRNFNERLYLRRRAQAQQKPKEVPAARSTRTGTSSRLQELKKARQARKQQESDYSESEDEDDEDDASDAQVDMEDEDDDDEIEKGGYGSVEWAEQDKPEELTLEDINSCRWGKTELSNYCHYPGFESVIRGCFVRVSVGYNAQLLQNAYICGQVVGLDKCDPYVFGDRRRVDQLLKVTYAGSEQGVEMGSCSDGNITASEFEAWKSEMDSKDKSLPTKRRVLQKAKETQAEQTRVLTSDEISEMVQKRQSLTGPSGSNVVIQRSQLEEQRQAALDAGDEEKVTEIDTQLELLSASRRQSRPATTKSALERLSERNRKSNLHSVRKAEVQAQVQRRKSGFALKADPFSRLRTNAKLFYNEKNAPVAQVEEPEGGDEAGKLSLSAIDSMIGSLDIKLKIVI